ncbi:hypothetical protein BV898_12797 [Hypsibius exemplaris]|uniref:Uncharacterized protein n=1 Tax=Hypsibius exemplaris TaxID=2072580 RepID=A0A1W0WCM0_HYPEX|nr:hypothetical protein BV898_12797 [Hypsibius exemplaris]
MPKWNLTPSRQYLLTEVASFTFPKPGSPDSGTVQRWICTMIGTQLILGGAILLIGLLTLAHLSTCQQQKSARTSAVLNSPSIRIQPLHPPPSFPTPSSAPASLVSMANYGKSTESARERNKDVFFCVLSASAFRSSPHILRFMLNSLPVV